MSLKNSQNDKKVQPIPFKVRKELQNLNSWKSLYTYLGKPNPDGAEKIEKKIQSIRDQYGLV